MAKIGNLEEVTKYLVKILEKYGFWFYFDSNRKFRFVSQIFHNILLHFISFYVFSLVYEDGIQELLGDKFMHVMTTTLTLILQHSLYWRQKEFAKLLETFRSVLPTRQEDRQNLIKLYTNILKFDKYFTYYAVSVITIFFLIPWSIDSIYYLFGYGEFASNVPKAFNRIRGMSAGRFHHWLTLAISCYYAYLWVASYISLFSTSVIILALTFIEMKLFKEKIVKDYKNFFLNNVEEIFPEIISRQSEIKRLHEVVVNEVGAPLGVKNCVIAAALCYVLFSVSSTKSGAGSAISAVAFTTFFSDCFATCYLAELVTNEAQEICESLYDLPWYSLSPKDRRDFALILLQASRPLVIDYRGIMDTSLKMFMQVCQSAYSYYMILNSMR